MNAMLRGRFPLISRCLHTHVDIFRHLNSGWTYFRSELTVLLFLYIVLRSQFQIAVAHLIGHEIYFARLNLNLKSSKLSHQQEEPIKP
jgi:hypothetical protein